ncbi:MAG: hypothetical protein KUG69_08970 [Marinosulfonomonas sp.]|nr:hypothetical protein [Marinosulfonomonas sp.]
MVGQSKILTVSYGTFSCTLEGFDDPFGTMRGIAEYFRDLAADDRYFGAEPPTPDAEMLHRIAETEVHKRVEARVNDGGVTLRQMDDAEDLHVSQETPALEQSSFTSPAEVAAKDTAEDAGATTAKFSPEIAAEGVAAKLARIRAVVSEDTYTEDEPVEEANISSPISAAFDDVQSDAQVEHEEIVDEVEQDDAEQVPVAEDASIKDEFEAEEPVVVEFEAAQEVSQEGTNEHDDRETVADAAEPEVEVEIEVELENLDEPAAETGKIEDFMRLAAETEADQDEFEAEPAIEPETATVEIEIEEEDETDVLEPAEDQQPDRAAIARVVKMRRADFEAAIAGGDLQELESEPQVEVAEAVEVAETVELAQAPEVVAPQIVEPEAVEPEAVEPEAVEPEAVEPAEQETAEQKDVAGSSLSPEDEADLMATLQLVQRESEAERRSEKEGRALMENDDIETDTKVVSRILEVTNTEMEETEGTRRRSAIAHLKAAVAATRADKFLSRKREKDDADELNEYRNDLAQVVRPKRPPEGKKVARQIAPLMLVSEQRVDEAPATEASDVAIQPRRVNSDELVQDQDASALGDHTEENIFADAGSFSDFAEEMGAVELPDLLEAAAAYASFVQGHAFFSRPQIMKAVAAVKDEEYTREEGLRSFGMLLRRGKIHKIKRGQFKIADSSRFNPQVRAVGE